MVVLGITDGISGGAAIVDGGRVVAAVNEERIVRLKMAYGFPRRSIEKVMEIAGASPEDIQYVGIATERSYFCDEVKPWDGWFESKNDQSIRSKIFNLVSTFGHLVNDFPVLEDLYHKIRNPIFRQRRRIIEKILNEEFMIFSKVNFVDHHLAHAASAFYTSGLEDPLVVTMDGGGDGLSSTIYSAGKEGLKKINEVSSYDSLGNYYSYITHIAGFKSQRHEGKITGLAAHGKPIYKEMFREWITYQDGKINNIGKMVFEGALKGIKKRLPSGYKIEDLAASIQMVSEDISREYIGFWLQRTGKRTVALAGGLFANVRINQEIKEISGVEKIFVHPGMEDGGLGVGAALAVNASVEPTKNVALDNVYLGPDYSGKEMEEAYSVHGLSGKTYECIEPEIARLLAKGYVVARFAGRMEYGPRALGNRSILYAPIDPSVNDWLNQNLRRTEFMPFAPSSLMEYADRCYAGLEGAEEAAQYMTITFRCTDWMKKNCAGVVHLDGTARPQLVEKTQNLSYYHIIEEFRKITGIPVIINTSFNVHEEPIVCSPQDAVRAFLDSNLDYLAMGNHLIKNPKPLSHALVEVGRHE